VAGRAVTPAGPTARTTPAMTRSGPIEHGEAILLVGIGGFAGSNLRYFAELAVPNSLVATLTVNVLGCFALGALVYEERFTDAVSAAGRTLVATGFLASFTTYSTFVVDALASAPTVAVGYVVASYALGFGAVLVGREADLFVDAVTAPRPEVDE